MASPGECWIYGTPGSGFKTTPLKDLHPLLFPPVLNKVFSHLSFWNHKKCRLVCKTWDQELKHHLRMSCKVNLTKLITEISKEDDGTGSFDAHGDKALLLTGLSSISTSFVIEEDPAILRVFTQQQIQPLHIKYLEIKNFKWDLNQVYQYILKELPHLEELRLPVTCFPCASSPPTNQRLKNTRKTNKYIRSSNGTLSKSPSHKRLQDETFPKLKSLIVTLTFRDLRYFDLKNTAVEPILKLLRSFPNLEEIYYPNLVQFTAPFDNPARVVLENIVYFPLSQQLSILKIDTFLSNKDLKILTARGFPLKSIQITVTQDVHCWNLYEFLVGTESTLRTLTLTFRDGFKLDSNFPALSQLERFSVILWNGYLDHLHSIPQLQALIIVLMEMEADFSHICRREFRKQSQIQELDIHAVSEEKSGIVDSLLRMCPQTTLRRLTVDSVSDEILQKIIISLPYLQELHVIGMSYFTDTGVTGIPSPFCRNDYMSNESYCLSLKRFPGLMDLTDLKSLILTGELTDFMVLMGVVRIKKLVTLELIGKCSSTISDQTLIRIGEMNLNFLRLKNLSGITDKGLQYLLHKLDGREVHIG